MKIGIDIGIADDKIHKVSVDGQISFANKPAMRPGGKLPLRRPARIGGGTQGSVPSGPSMSTPSDATTSSFGGDG